MATSFTPPSSDLVNAALNKIYMENFGRPYDPTNVADSYWAKQILAGKEAFNNPYNLARDIVGGASGDDAAYYNTMAKAAQSGNAITTLKPEDVYAGLSNADALATAKAAQQGVPGFSMTNIPQYFGMTPAITGSNATALANDASQWTGLPASSFADPGATAQQIANYQPVQLTAQQAAYHTPTSQLPSQSIGYEANLAAVRANPIEENALQGAIAQHIPGFDVAKRGGAIKTKKKPSDSFVTFNSNRR
jgi:hypothetical protein